MIAGVSGGKNLIESTHMQGAVRTFGEAKRAQFSFYEKYERFAGDTNRDCIINGDDSNIGNDYTHHAIVELFDKGYASFKPNMNYQKDIAKVNPSLYKNEAYYTFVDDAVMLLRRNLIDARMPRLDCKFIANFLNRVGYDTKDENNKYLHGNMTKKCCYGSCVNSSDVDFYIKIEGMGCERFLSNRITDEQLSESDEPSQ